MTLQEKYAQLSRFSMALLTGAVVLFPSIVGILRAPFILDVALYAFWALAVPALLSLAVAAYLASFTDQLPHRAAGAGNLLTVLALVNLVLYVGANIISDRVSPPRVTSLLVEPLVVRPGQPVKLTATAEDQDGDELSWSWSVQLGDEGSAPIFAVDRSTSGVAQWRVPVDAPPGEYIVVVSVLDDGGVGEARVKFSVVGEAPCPSQCSPDGKSDPKSTGSSSNTALLRSFDRMGSIDSRP